MEGYIMANAEQPNQALSPELVAAIRKKAIEEVAKYAVVAFVGLLSIAALGWWFYIKQNLPIWLGTVPPGAIIALDNRGGCRSLGGGWEEMSELRGRVIVGAVEG